MRGNHKHSVCRNTAPFCVVGEVSHWPRLCRALVAFLAEKGGKATFLPFGNSSDVHFSRSLTFRMPIICQSEGRNSGLTGEIRRGSDVDWAHPKAQKWHTRLFCRVGQL